MFHNVKEEERCQAVVWSQLIADGRRRNLKNFFKGTKVAFWSVDEFFGRRLPSLHRNFS